MTDRMQRDPRPKFVIVTMLDNKPVEVLTNGDGPWRTMAGVKEMKVKLEDATPYQFTKRIKYYIVKSGRA